MKEVCDLDRRQANFGWCFDCVPEENSLLLRVDGELFEMPAQNLIYLRAQELLGAAERAAAEQVVAKHGAGFVAAMEDFAAALGREYEACLQQTKE